MSDTDDYDDDSYEETPQPKQNWRRKLEAEAEEGRKAKADAEQARRELAFYRAQIPMDAPGISYFVKGYEGELDPDAIRKAATEAGFLRAPDPDPTLQQELRDQQAYSQAATGAFVNDGKVTQSQAVAQAKKAADSAPPHMAAQVYADTLQSLGFGQMGRPPA